MRGLFVLPVVIALAGCGAAVPPTPTPTPSVLISTVPARQGTLPSTVMAYGSAGPALNGVQTPSEAQPGQVMALLVTPGVAVRAGQSLATFILAPAARGIYSQAVNAVAAAQKQRLSTAQLLTQQLATQDQLAQATKTLADAQAALAALQADGAGQGVQTLTAPFDGVVTAIMVAQGARTQAGAPILTVVRAGGIVVSVGIDPAERAAVAVGQTAMLHRLSGGQSMVGKVIRVDSALNALTRLVDADVSFPTGALLLGEGVRVAIETGQVRGWVVPHKSVVTTGGPSRIFQAVGGKANAVPVHVLLSSDRGDVVQGGVDGHSPLIVDGAYQISDGDAVRRSN